MQEFVMGKLRQLRKSNFALDMPQTLSEACQDVLQWCLQAVDEFNDVVPKALGPIFIDFRHSSLHIRVATDATFFADELDGLVDDVDFVHLSFSLVLETFGT